MNRYQTIINFLTNLGENNNKEWFDAHRDEYKNVKKIVDSLTLELIEHLSKADSNIVGLTVSQCTYRINRDIRFSANKDPYKTHIGIYISKQGKKSGYAGYYIHFEPSNDANVFISAGLYCPIPKVLKSLREEILDNGDCLMSNIDAASKFSLLDMGDTLKRTPRDFPNDTPYDNLLRMKHLLIEKSLSEHFFDDDSTLAQRIVDEFKPTIPFITQINQAVQYAYDEM